MIRKLTLLAVSLFTAIPLTARSGGYTDNREPFAPKAFMEFPLGSIRADGWLLEML